MKALQCKIPPIFLLYYYYYSALLNRQASFPKELHMLIPAILYVCIVQAVYTNDLLWICVAENKINTPLFALCIIIFNVRVYLMSYFDL